MLKKRRGERYNQVPNVNEHKYINISEMKNVNNVRIVTYVKKKEERINDVQQ